MTPKDELKLLIKRFPWVLEELVWDQKTQEAVAILNGGDKDSFAYLREKFGSGNAVLGQIKGMVKSQPHALKSLALPGRLEAHQASKPIKKKRK